MDLDNPGLSLDLPSLSRILGYLTLQEVGRACMVCKAWRATIEGDEILWRDLLIRKGLWFGGESEANFCKMLMKHRRKAIVSGKGVLPLAHPYKVLFKSRYLTLTRWISNPSPKHISFPVHGHSVVTCLLFSQNRIISASDDQSIGVYSPTTGRLLQSLEGHEGGVWALAVHGDLLVSGSTDRTVRIWDLREGRCLHVFGGHTSTVRCLTIVKPEWITHPETGKREKWPKHTVIISGSRDHTLRIWKLPKRGEREFDSRLPMSQSVQNSDPPDPSVNPYHLNLLSEHTHAVRGLAARGRTAVSGSYDCTVRVWDIPTGSLVHTLTGHTQKVYSVVLDLRDGMRGRVASGSMDGTVRLWSLTTGDCLHVLSGHTSLVGLLGISPSFLVSAAADSTLRVWDARFPTLTDDSVPTTPSGNSNELLKGILAAHTGAITCFQHDEWKVVSGSDGTLKVWDLRNLNTAFSSQSQDDLKASGSDGPAVPVMRDLLTRITGVWQVAFEGRWCVSASNRNDATFMDVWDFGRIESPDDMEQETREREMEEDNVWTWEDEEWIGEPQVYDYEDSEVEDEGSPPDQ